MEEIQLIKKLELLKATKPNNEWVSLVKRDIMNKQFEAPVATFASVLNTIGSAFETPKALVPVLASLLVGVFGFALVTAQNTVPGDGLYSLKQAYEQIRISMLSPEEKAVAQVEQVNDRLTELDKITEGSENQEKKLAAGIIEFQKALVVASKQLSKLPESQKAELVGSIVSKIEKIEKTTNAAIVDNESEDYQAFYKFLAESEIKELEANAKNLTVNQLNLLSQAKENFDVGDYAKAVDVLYQIQPEAK
jgi:hypothetical protein